MLTEKNTVENSSKKWWHRNKFEKQTCLQIWTQNLWKRSEIAQKKNGGDQGKDHPGYKIKPTCRESSADFLFLNQHINTRTDHPTHRHTTTHQHNKSTNQHRGAGGRGWDGKTQSWEEDTASNPTAKRIGKSGKISPEMNMRRGDKSLIVKLSQNAVGKVQDTG